MPLELSSLDQLKAETAARDTIVDRIDQLLGDTMPPDPHPTYDPSRDLFRLDMVDTSTPNDLATNVKRVRVEQLTDREHEAIAFAQRCHDEIRRSRADIEPGGYQSVELPSIILPPDCERCEGWHPDNECPAKLDEWRTTYGRLDIPTSIIDWRPIAAGALALTLSLIARRMVRHG